MSSGISSFCFYGASLESHGTEYHLGSMKWILSICLRRMSAGKDGTGRPVYYFSKAGALYRVRPLGAAISGDLIPLPSKMHLRSLSKLGNGMV